VLASGVDLDHPDINRQVVLRANFSSAATNEDKYGRGTHVAGIRAASHDTVGVAGVCPECTSLPAMCLTTGGLDPAQPSPRVSTGPSATDDKDAKASFSTYGVN
jgi:hypothetical protein